MLVTLRACLLFAVALPTVAGAFDYVVTRYDDPVPDGCLPTDCTLREAVIAANVADSADRVLLSAGVYALTLTGNAEEFAASGDLDVRRNLEIVGVGAGLTVIDGTGLDQVILSAAAAVVGGAFDFTLRGVTVRNSDRGGIALIDGNYTIEDCEIRDNGTTSSHHGISTAIATTLLLRRVAVHGNSGIGLFATQSAVTVENSTFSGNGSREITVNGGVSFTCLHCTISDPADSEAELFVQVSDANFANSLIAGDCGFGTDGAIVSDGGNVESPGNVCFFDQASDLFSQTSGQLDLGALVVNGGPTPTHLPGAASVANGNALDALCLDTDQRGVPRETNCESGAVEQTSARVSTPIFIDGFQQGSLGAWSPASAP